MNLKSALAKDTLREIKKSFGRFISIFAIVAIGVAFFAGVKASVPVMKNTADSYYDEYSFMDFKILSTLGLTANDIKEISKIEGINGVYAGYSMDALQMKNNHQSVLKVLSYPMDAQANDPNNINQYRLVNGRLPKNENECVIEHISLRGTTNKMGEQITLTSGNDTSIKDTLKNTTYTIVGEVTSPNYLSYEKGTATIGSGKVDNYIVIPDVNFKSDVYTEAYVSVEGAKALNSYEDIYFDTLQKVEDTLTSLGKKRADIRLEEIKSDAMKEIVKGEAAYAKNEKNFLDGIKAGKDQLSLSKIKLTDAQIKLDNEKANLKLTFLEKEKELQSSQTLLNDNQRQYEQGYASYSSNKAKYEAGLPAIQEQTQTLKKQASQLLSAIEVITQQLALPGLSEQQKEALIVQQTQLQTQLKQVQTAVSSIDTKQKQAQFELTTAKAKLDQANRQLVNAKQQIANGKEQLAQGKQEAERSFAQAQETFNIGNQKYKDGLEQLNAKEKGGKQELQKAKDKLTQAKAKLNDLASPRWFVLDRHSHYSYMDFGSAADRMGAIAKVFPLFFFLVAALVCLTTMTRMVDEQRQEIGTLKALGYKKSYIAMKYIAYAGLASVFGGIFGAVVGMIIFPMVIFNAWGIMYSLPSVELQLQLGLGVIAVVIAAAITIMAAVSACYKELVETPSTLMRPKAPKNGKKILLERIPLIWKHLNFIQKVTARNIFRYKKRFFMTVIGISGCTALLVAGFGIRDSIGEIVIKQYGEIYEYDVTMNYKKDSTIFQKEEVLKALQKDERIEGAMSLAVYHGTFEADDKENGIDLYVPENLDTFDNFINLRTRVGHKALTIQQDGAIISEKAANLNHLSVGDTLMVDKGDGIKKKVKITGIMENYVGHVLYMSTNYYEQLYGVQADDMAMIAKMKTTDTQSEQALGNDFMKHPAIESVTFYSGIATTFQDTISSLLIVVIVLIISAGILAFVVLYNLTNVNISERLREIATIKVLGFYDKEVSAYVYRENILLTLIGACVGLLLGIALHALIMSIAEMDTIMFGRNINMLSFLYSLAITMIFAIIVNGVMYGKLKKIPMVESLKSVE